MRCSRMSPNEICPDCQLWQKKFAGDDPLAANHSIFVYNETMQQIIAKWKYRGDYILGNAFKTTFRKGFQQYFGKWKNPIVIPIPLSEERLEERGFNQAQMLAEFLPAKISDSLSRTAGEKQSKKNRKQRLSAQNPFRVDRPINKAVILVDDIYTTGTTLRHAASVLKENGCPKVAAYTLIRG
ncbi:ComF family protein [Virgibacillus sp. 179-BFC.A HS]|uniref:ComF family protein n=1 Tax=Tigheibacillus jepli TaxID=3035914 RepID=A0ABU5CHS4_9BACI|nr:ComF family protein [Virgibacillus sp. 179-BFC.A HS]MDY0405083.1 ComF family protein [Virgibacillus sp. 179-BFC.A HS]